MKKRSKINFKILYWGIEGSGKTTILNTLYRITTEQTLDIIPTEGIQEIAMENGIKVYIDKGILQSKQHEKSRYYVYTIAGQTRFSTLKKELYDGTDGILLMPL